MEPRPGGAATRNGAKTGRGSSCKEAATEAKEDQRPQETTARSMRRKWGTKDPEEPRWKRRCGMENSEGKRALKRRGNRPLSGDARPSHRRTMAADSGHEKVEIRRPRRAMDTEAPGEAPWRMQRRNVAPDCSGNLAAAARGMRPQGTGSKRPPKRALDARRSKGLGGPWMRARRRGPDGGRSGGFQRGNATAFPRPQ